MTRTFTIEKGQKPTQEQLKEVMEAKKYPIVADEDAPELSPAMYKALKSCVIQNDRDPALPGPQLFILRLSARRWYNIPYE